MLGSYHGRSITLSTTLNDRHCTRRSRPSIFFTSTTISPLTRLVTVRNLDRSTPPTKVPQGRRRQLECFSAICRGRRPMRAKHQYFYSLICEHAYWDRRPDSSNRLRPEGIPFSSLTPPTAIFIDPTTLGSSLPFYPDVPFRSCSLFLWVWVCVTHV